MMIFGVEVGEHTYTRESVERYIEQAYKAGQEDERAKIVARLRDDRSMIGNALRFAHWIEKGGHLK